MKVAVIGAGRLGREFALSCARAGHQVVLEDVMPDRLRQAGVAFAALGQEVALVATVEDAVLDADLAIDFVPDDLESKLEIWSLLDRMAPPHTILCTPSEELSVTDLASCTYRPDRCVMVRGALAAGSELDLLHAPATSAATREQAAELFASLGHPLRVLADPDLPMLLKNMNAPSL